MRFVSEQTSAGSRERGSTACLTDTRTSLFFERMISVVPGVRRFLLLGVAAVMFSATAAGTEQPYRSPGTLQPHAARRVPEPWPPPAVMVTVEPAQIERGGTARLRWVVRHARRVFLDGVEIAPFGDVPVSPSSTTDYVITATSGDARAEGTATVRVAAPPDPPSIRFYAIPSEILPGDTVMLLWSVRDAASVTLDGRRIDPEGQMIIQPVGPRRYEIEARHERATSRASAVVTMRMPPVPSCPPAPPAPTTLTVHFAFEESVLREEDLEALAAMARTLRDHPSQVLLVVGHTDARGGERFNRDLGAARAASVRDWIVQQHGISPSRIRVETRGEAEPVAANAGPAGRDNPEGRARNRRAELRLIPEAS